MHLLRRRLPRSASELSAVAEVARLIATRFNDREPCLLIRYGDTSGRIMARARPDTPEFAYLKRFLGAAVMPDQVDVLAGHIERSIISADVIGLRSDLMGPDMSDEILHAPDDQIRQRLIEAYPIRDFERTRLEPDGARRLAQTRKAMENFELPADALLTDAWIHVSLAEVGFLAALMREAPSISIVTSTERRSVVQRLAETLPNRVRYFECPCYPWTEQKWGGDHSFLWHRWNSLISSLEPSYRGEPMFISAGIWTKAIGPIWASRGGIALDVGSVMDYLEKAPTRPAVLATRYGDAKMVPHALSLDAQLENPKLLADFLGN